MSERERNVRVNCFYISKFSSGSAFNIQDVLFEWIQYNLEKLHNNFYELYIYIYMYKKYKII